MPPTRLWPLAWSYQTPKCNSPARRQHRLRRSALSDPCRSVLSGRLRQSCRLRLLIPSGRSGLWGREQWTPRRWGRLGQCRSDLLVREQWTQRLLVLSGLCRSDLWGRRCLSGRSDQNQLVQSGRCCRSDLLRRFLLALLDLLNPRRHNS